MQQLGTAISTAERVMEVLVKVSELPELEQNLDLRLYDLDLLDSLKTAELIVAFYDQFGVTISPADLDRERWASPRLIIQDILERMGSVRQG